MVSGVRGPRRRSRPQPDHGAGSADRWGADGVGVRPSPAAVPGTVVRGAHLVRTHIDAIAPRASLTERARERLAAMVNIDGFSIAAAALEFGVGWHAANAAVADYTDPAVDDPDRLDGVRGIGVDEKRFLNATAEHRTVFTTQIVDLDRHRLLDVVQGRSRDVLAGWLNERGDAWCAQITLATLDPAAGYRAALVEHLPNATLVVDHFHAIKVRHEASCIRRRVRDPPLRAVAAAR